MRLLHNAQLCYRAPKRPAPNSLWHGADARRFSAPPAGCERKGQASEPVSLIGRACGEGGWLELCFFKNRGMQGGACRSPIPRGSVELGDGPGRPISLFIPCGTRALGEQVHACSRTRGNQAPSTPMQGQAGGMLLTCHLPLLRVAGTEWGGRAGPPARQGEEPDPIFLGLRGCGAQDHIGFPRMQIPFSG